MKKLYYYSLNSTERPKNRHWIQVIYSYYYVYLFVSDPKLFRWSKNQKLLFSFLLLLIVILLAGLITVLILYLKQLSSVKPNNDEKTDFENQKVSTFFDDNVESPSNVCNSVQCVRSSAEILNSMDLSVDPCEDFYGFVCNGWIQKHPIPKVFSLRVFFFIISLTFLSRCRIMIFLKSKTEQTQAYN